MLLSVIFRSPATAALVALGRMAVLYLSVAGTGPALAELLFSGATLETAVIGSQMLARFSPSTLFGEVVLALPLQLAR
jgi:ABC-2 type transport system permease protein